MVKPNLTKAKIVEKLTAMKNSSLVVGEQGLAVALDDLINEIKKDLN